jgi:TetR/AcrR family tetracycline transcriptional repressor
LERDVGFWPLMFDNDLDDRFEAGIDLLISGLKARIDIRS